MLAGKIEEHRMGELITKDDLLKIENRIFDKIGNSETYTSPAKQN